MRAQYRVWSPEILLKTLGVLCASLFLARPKCRLVLRPMLSMSLRTATNVVYVASYCDQCRLCRFVLRPKKRHCRLCRLVVRPQKRQCRLCRLVLRPKKRHCRLCRFVLRPKKWHHDHRNDIFASNCDQKRECRFKPRPQRPTLSTTMRLSLMTDFLSVVHRQSTSILQ